MSNPKAKKRFGQNFLVDEGAIQAIVDATLVSPTPDTILEIGPGRGALTKVALETGVKVLALEAERDTANALRKAELSGLSLVEGDALKWPLAMLSDEMGLDLPCRIMANLPYNISTPLLRQFLQQHGKWERMVLMFQKEVADRILAVPGTRAYSSLSVLTQTFSRPTLLLDLGPSSFRPAPKVDSAVLVLTPSLVELPDYAKYAAFLHQAFNPRRKKLRPRLCAERQAWLDQQNMSDVRPQAIPVKHWPQLFVAGPSGSL